LRVIGDEHVAATGRALIRRGDRQVHFDAHRREVVREALAEVIVGHFADVAARPPSAATPAMEFATEPPDI